MYALGLIASFCINMGSLIIYRYSKGKSEGVTYSPAGSLPSSSSSFS